MPLTLEDACVLLRIWEVEYGLRPLSREKAGRLEVLLGIRPGAYTLEARRGRPALSEASWRVLRELRRHRELPRQARNRGVAPKFPHSDPAQGRFNLATRAGLCWQ